MPQDSGIALAAMAVYTLLEFIIYSFVMLVQCWIIARRRGVAGGWWNWLIPFWNLYTAYKVGDGPMKSGAVLLCLIAAGSVGVLFAASKTVMLGGTFLLFCRTVPFVLCALHLATKYKYSCGCSSACFANGAVDTAHGCFCAVHYPCRSTSASC